LYYSIPSLFNFYQISNRMLILKSPDEIELMAEGGARLARVLRQLTAETRAGVTTRQLDRIAYELIHQAGGKPAFLNYRPSGARRPYPYTLCASVNDVVVHGQPSDCVIQDGDLVKIDLGLVYKKFYTDTAVTVAVGEGAGAVSREAKRLIAATQEALAAAIKEIKPGTTLGDIGFAIAQVARKNKCGIADGLGGHGIGRSLHEDPFVFNFGKRGEGEELRPGMVLAIEPMFTSGGAATRQVRADESYATRDGSLAAHFEHTVAVVEGGARILTE
jgi:methionyl aminopeptidase